MGELNQSQAKLEGLQKEHGRTVQAMTEQHQAALQQLQQEAQATQAHAQQLQMDLDNKAKTMQVS